MLEVSALCVHFKWKKRISIKLDNERNRNKGDHKSAGEQCEDSAYCITKENVKTQTHIIWENKKSKTFKETQEMILPNLLYVNKHLT